ncbi:MAG: S-layer homology domain-containing protein [Cyanobacteria bacterium Co-bin13]|nr:S-layer homology domain-containing protein [Cyanobacteria bacterium Co-bin13]
MTPSRSLLTAFLLGFSLFVTGCAGSSLGNSLERSLEADPQLADNPPFGTQTGSGDSSTEVEGDTAATPTPDAGSPAEPGQSDSTTAAGALPDSSSEAAVLAEAPEELRPYAGDLLALDLLSKAPAEGETQTAQGFSPNQVITRSDYARWLLTANNRFYSDQPDRRIRAGIASATPAFKDVPTSHPDFAAIQGLAEAGLIPSALTGNSTAVNFRPDDPLTRKDLILWKVPLDTRQGLPTASVEAVTESWGFQDAGKIEPLALRAIAADYQNGEFSNIRRAFGYTTLFQPDRGVTEAEAAAVLWRFGSQTEGVSAAQVRQGDAAPAAAASPETRSQPAQPRPSTTR